MRMEHFKDLYSNQEQACRCKLKKPWSHYRVTCIYTWTPAKNKSFSSCFPVSRYQMEWGRPLFIEHSLLNGVHKKSCISSFEDISDCRAMVLVSSRSCLRLLMTQRTTDNPEETTILVQSNSSMKHIFLQKSVDQERFLLCKFPLHNGISFEKFAINFMNRMLIQILWGMGLKITSPGCLLYLLYTIL